MVEVNASFENKQYLSDHLNTNIYLRSREEISKENKICFYQVLMAVIEQILDFC